MSRLGSASSPALAYYINGHGFGHATRSIAILNEIWKRAPEQHVVLRTDAPAFLFRRSCTGPYRLLEGEVDPGTVQPDPLHLDRAASLAARGRFQVRLPRLVEKEVARLTPEGVGLVAGDIPPLAFETAAALGVKSVALGNFSWDWIYDSYVEGCSRHRALVDGLRRSYRRADLLLRMPLHGAMDAFRRVEDIPHVVRPLTEDRGAVRRALGLAGERRPMVVISFGGFAAVSFSGERAPDPGPFRFVVFGETPPGLPGDTVRLPVDHGHRHEDLVAAADAVVTKPGYGTIAECLAARTPFLYTSRDDFREYDVLVEGIRDGARTRFVPREDLLGLRWRVHLEALLADAREWAPVAADGARVAAHRLLDLLERR